MRSGFRSAGLVPFSPEKVLNSPLLKEITAAPQSNQEIPIQTTPKQPDNLSVPVSLNERDARMFLKEVHERESAKNTRITQLERENLGLKRRLEELEPVKRKRIKPQPNSRFQDTTELMLGMLETSQARLDQAQGKKKSGIKIRLNFTL